MGLAAWETGLAERAQPAPEDQTNKQTNSQPFGARDAQVIDRCAHGRAGALRHLIAQLSRREVCKQLSRSWSPRWMREPRVAALQSSRQVPTECVNLLDGRAHCATENSREVAARNRARLVQGATLRRKERRPFLLFSLLPLLLLFP